MTGFRNARDLQDEIEELVGHEVDAVTVNHNQGEITVDGVTDQELEEIRQNVDPQASSRGSFHSSRADEQGNRGTAGQGGG